MEIILIWVTLAVFIGWAGHNTTAGFWGGFLLSLILSPLIAAIILICLPSKEQRAYRDQMMYNQQQQILNQQQQLQNLQQTTTPTNNQSVADELTKIKKLKDDGIIDEAEYSKMKSRLMAAFD